jgi:hypothetical protein
MMELKGTFELENGITIVDPNLEITEIKQSNQQGVCFVNFELSVVNAIAKLSFIYHFDGIEPNEKDTMDWVLSQIETYKV